MLCLGQASDGVGAGVEEPRSASDQDGWRGKKDV